NTMAAVNAPKAIVIGSAPAAPQALLSTPPASSTPLATLPQLFPGRPTLNLPVMGPFALPASPAAVAASAAVLAASPTAMPASVPAGAATRDDSQAQLVFSLAASSGGGSNHLIALDTWHSVDEDLIDLLALSARRVTALRKR